MVITNETPVLLPEMSPLAGMSVVERTRCIGVGMGTRVEILRLARLPGTGGPARSQRKRPHPGGERTYYDGDGRAVETADIFVPEHTG
ncbi:hypothetical protein [Streptomyces sp. NPDC050388]|uniref:hypothetical protein n=1 Tax=Streptomyces sp. NPDC050388 TaxID=3155781 RepID=UPI00342EDC8D